jgi:hypothetical protein
MRKDQLSKSSEFLNQALDGFDCNLFEEKQILDESSKKLIKFMLLINRFNIIF